MKKRNNTAHIVLKYSILVVEFMFKSVIHLKKRMKTNMQLSSVLLWEGIKMQRTEKCDINLGFLQKNIFKTVYMKSKCQ